MRKLPSRAARWLPGSSRQASEAGEAPAKRPELRSWSSWPVWLAATLALAFLAVPVIGLLQRTPWSNLFELLGTERVLDALAVSAMTSFSAAGLSVLAGLPLAWLLRHSGAGVRRVMRALVLLPMVLPPVVGGTALLFALGRRGLLGQWMERIWGWSLPFSTAGAVVAATFVALPFFVVTVEAALSGVDFRLVEAARTLGARPLTAFRRVILPLIRPAVAAGAALAWARALGEFGATVTFAGNVAGRTQTLPLAAFVALEAGRAGEAMALSVLLLVASAVVLIGLRDHWLAR